MSIYCKIQKRFHNFQLNIEFSGDNETLALLGPSGAGKSMILRCIAGIEKPDSGRIVVDDHVLFDSQNHINLSPQERKVGLLFQDYALFPNMTVAENISLSMDSNYDETLAQLLESYQLTEQQHQYPHQLSGGQKQRCALARMIATCPDIILLDEPFSSLDSFLKYHLEKELFTKLKSYGKTVLFVSHNRNEIYRLSDKVAIIANGQNNPMVEKHELFEHPTDYNSALLTGCKNIFPAIKKENQILIPNLNLSFSYEYNQPFHYVGIHSRDISYIEDSTPLDAQWICSSFHIQSVTEGLHHYILNIQFPHGQDTFIWEVSKDKLAHIDERKGKLAIKKKSILFLTE